jgi:hypothetical protein
MLTSIRTRDAIGMGENTWGSSRAGKTGQRSNLAHNSLARNSMGANTTLEMSTRPTCSQPILLTRRQRGNLRMPSQPRDVLQVECAKSFAPCKLVEIKFSDVWQGRRIYFVTCNSYRGNVVV